MFNLLAAVFVYTAVFLTDYIFYKKLGSRYSYVSRRTWLLITFGQITLVALFWSEFRPFVEHWRNEVIFLMVLTAFMSFFCYLLSKERLLVCYTTSRTEGCLTPAYVVVKGAEIVFQQLAYLGVALAVVDLVGFNLVTFLLYTFILLIMHTPVIISCNKDVAYKLTFGLAVISAPILYIFTEIHYFFPAVYLHSLLYVFYWITFADFEPKQLIVTTKGG